MSETRCECGKRGDYVTGPETPDDDGTVFCRDHAREAKESDEAGTPFFSLDSGDPVYLDDAGVFHFVDTES